MPGDRLRIGMLTEECASLNSSDGSYKWKRNLRSASQHMEKIGGARTKRQVESYLDFLRCANLRRRRSRGRSLGYVSEYPNYLLALKELSNLFFMRER